MYQEAAKGTPKFFYSSSEVKSLIILTFDFEHYL